MDFRRLRTFVTVAEHGSVSKAAQVLRISQPGLSRQLQDLQYELKLRLFDRVGRRLVLTTEGEQLLGSCRTLLSQANSITEQAQLLRRGDTGVLRVAVSPVELESVLSGFLPQYTERYPNVQVKPTEAIGTALTLVERGDVHVGISGEAIPAEDPHVGVYPVPPLELLAACHQSYRLERGALIDVRRVAPHPLLMPDLSFRFRRTFDAVCRLARLSPNILTESRSPNALLALAEAGLGVAIISTAIKTDRYALRTVRITYRGKPIGQPQAIVWNRRRAFPHYAQDFCEMLAARMRKPSKAGSGIKAPRG